LFMTFPFSPPMPLSGCTVPTRSFARARFSVVLKSLEPWSELSVLVPGDITFLERGEQFFPASALIRCEVGARAAEAPTPPQFFLFSLRTAASVVSCQYVRHKVPLDPAALFLLRSPTRSPFAGRHRSNPSLRGLFFLVDRSPPLKALSAESQLFSPEAFTPFLPCPL